MSSKLGQISDEFYIKDLIRTKLKWSPERLYKWFESRNPMFGGVSPRRMIAIGKAKNLIRFVETQLEENFPD